MPDEDFAHPVARRKRQAALDAEYLTLMAQYAPRDRDVVTEPRRVTPGLVYFIGCQQHSVKIGFTTQLDIRLAALQNSSPVPLAVLAIVEAAPSLEREYHARFAAHRLHGEWFEPHPDILAEIERLAPHPHVD